MIEKNTHWAVHKRIHKRMHTVMLRFRITTNRPLRTVCCPENHIVSIVVVGCNRTPLSPAVSSSSTVIDRMYSRCGTFTLARITWHPSNHKVLTIMYILQTTDYTYYFHRHIVCCTLCGMCRHNGMQSYYDGHAVGVNLCCLLNMQCERECVCVCSHTCARM